MMKRENHGDFFLGGGAGQGHVPKVSFLLDAAYEILEMKRSNTDKEIKKAYRKLALNYQPDRVLHLGKAKEKSAKEKFQKVAEAYDMVKKSRAT